MQTFLNGYSPGDASESQSDAHQYLSRLLKDGAKKEVDIDVNSYEIKLPSFYDKVKYERARKFYFDNIYGFFISNLTGLVSILAIQSILKVLICTKQSSTPKTAYRRYLATILHVVNFYSANPDANSKCYKSIAAVRKKHIKSSKYAEKHNSGSITQKDMALTQFGFLGFVLVQPKMMGIRENGENFEALVHLWRVVGYMLGIDNEFNICTDSLSTTLPRLRLMVAEILVPCLKNQPPHFHEMVQSMIEGLWCFNPFLTTPAFTYLTYRAAGVPGYYYGKEEQALEMQRLKNTPDRAPENSDSDGMSPTYKKMPWWSRFIVGFIIYILETLVYGSTIFRWIFNYNITSSLFIIKWFPFLAFPKFGFRASYVRILNDAN
ncbi:uncharacterized protein LOC132257968 [Phlebotomus argentipes]|uniref:uncharacterized protein LOC132257968 n=1 Tax=Phlebotomus argentipes TaxID=94469 RepID=UPI0028929E7E|nr:uncharacterized protein LOC132257968 [Phlebotomus argentipes]